MTNDEVRTPPFVICASSFFRHSSLDIRHCRQMAQKIYISGRLYDAQDAKISVYDHGLLYGDGVFEGLRSYGGKVFCLEQHLARLWNSAKANWLENPKTRE